VDRNHYIDEGCKCVLCNKKREEIKLGLKEKKELNIKIRHNELKESKDRRISFIGKKMGKEKVFKDMSKMSIIGMKRL
jgi:hypothetical protein